ncbi:MAG TPA: sodium:solute symporter family protein [Vicinamibacterales bacterium]|nr:sodium:solute symporter family protein [Vicinamibacterales bacterium]
MSLHLTLLVIYSLSIVGLGIWSARYVRTSSAFFVADRSLGPGLIFASMLAANIGAGATVNVAGIAYREGLSAWWWSGSAGLASFLLAFFVGPRLWILAREHGFYTTGDFLEHRYGASVRAIVTSLVAFGSLWILAAQLIAGASIINVLTGAPRWVGSVAGGAIMTIYFAAGGLLGTAWINSVQLIVMLVGFIFALPYALEVVGGVGAFTSPALPEGFADITYSSGPGSGWTLLALTGPAFVVSPGLIQKSFGAANERALRLGIAANGAALMLFAFFPVLLGMTARVGLPEVSAPDLVLPRLLMELLPAWLGALAMAAVFSTEVDTCDAILFMISTSVSKDLFKRYVRPTATDDELLVVARVAAVAGGVLGVLLSIYLSTIVQAMTVFYSLLGVSLFAPVVGGLYSKRAGSLEALSAIAAGVVTLLVVRYGVAGTYRWLDPTLSGLIAAGIGFVGVLAFRGRIIR